MPGALTATTLLALALGGSVFAAAAAAPAKPATAATAAKAAPAAAAASAPAAGPGDPVVIIKKKDAELQKLLRETAGKAADAKKTERIKVLINGIFDFEELGKRALGPDTWKTMTPAQQSHFVKAFKEMVENSSVKKLEVYQSDSTSYEPTEMQDGGKASVTSHVFSKGQESIVTYKLQYKDTAWKAWDLVIDDLSTSRNYGEQFRKILQSSNMDGLIAKLEKKAAGGPEAKTTDSMKAKSEKNSKAAAASTVSPAAKAPSPAAQSTPPKTSSKP